MSRAVDRREINPRLVESGLQTIIVGWRLTGKETIGSKEASNTGRALSMVINGGRISDCGGKTE